MRFQVVPAAYVYLMRGGSVLLQLRHATGYADGQWACAAAGHIEHGESVFAAACRGTAEETGVEIVAADLLPLTVMHRTQGTDHPRLRHPRLRHPRLRHRRLRCVAVSPTGATPVDLRTDRPHSARIYDHLIGGRDDYAAERAAAENLISTFPDASIAVRDNRLFMHRAALPGRTRS